MIKSYQKWNNHMLPNKQYIASKSSQTISHCVQSAICLISLYAFRCLKRQRGHSGINDFVCSYVNERTMRLPRRLAGLCSATSDVLWRRSRCLTHVRFYLDSLFINNLPFKFLPALFPWSIHRLLCRSPNHTVKRIFWGIYFDQTSCVYQWQDRSLQIVLLYKRCLIFGKRKNTSRDQRVLLHIVPRPAAPYQSLSLVRFFVSDSLHWSYLTVQLCAKFLSSDTCSRCHGDLKTRTERESVRERWGKVLENQILI